MTFKQFAFNNVRRNTRQYVSYFLSCMFAVTVFFMYAVLVFHPEVNQMEFKEVVHRGIIVTEAIIYVFSFLFVLYSTGSFVKSRKREYGLLTTLGITKSQLNRMLILENTIIGIASIISGLLLGALLTKLFLMIFSQVLGLNEMLPFYLSLKAIGITAILFFIMFELNSIAVVWTIRTNSVMEIFRGAKAPIKSPKFSWIVSILSILAIAAAYYLAYTANLLTIFIRMIPILLLIIPGTYFLFTQCSIAFVSIIRKKKSYYYKKLNLLMISDLAYKLRDHARLLFFVATLCAVALTSSGVIYGLFQSVKVESERFVPQDISLIHKGLENREAFEQEVANVKTKLKEHGIAYESTTVASVQSIVHSASTDWNNTWVMLYPYSAYKRISEFQGKSAPLSTENRTATVLYADHAIREEMNIPDSFTLQSENAEITLSVESTKSNVNGNIYTTYPVLVPDKVYQKFYQNAEKNEVYQTYLFNIPNWQSHAEEIVTILDNVNREFAVPDSQASFYIQMKQGMSFLFFFGIFISVLFFLAAGSILYFRMYQNIDKDLHYYHSLYRIGLTDKEMKKIATKQLAYLFFIPFLVAVIHAGFAYKALQNMLVSNLLGPSITIIAVFFVVHLLNFIVIRNIYTAKLKKVM